MDILPLFVVLEPVVPLWPVQFCFSNSSNDWSVNSSLCSNIYTYFVSVFVLLALSSAPFIPILILSLLLLSFLCPIHVVVSYISASFCVTCCRQKCITNFVPFRKVKEAFYFSECSCTTWCIKSKYVRSEDNKIPLCCRNCRRWWSLHSFVW